MTKRVGAAAAERASGTARGAVHGGLPRRRRRYRSASQWREGSDGIRVFEAIFSFCVRYRECIFHHRAATKRRVQQLGVRPVVGSPKLKFLVFKLKAI